MKKIMTSRFLILALAIIFTISMTGCGTQSTQSKQGEKPLNINLIGATLGGGGVWDLIATGVAETIKQKLPGSSITSTPGEGVANATSIHKNEAELGLTHSSIAAAAFKGIDPFKEKFTDIKAIAALYPSVLQFVVRKDLPVTSIKEIVDKKYKIKLAVGNPGSTGELATNRILSAYGATYKDIESWGGKIYFKDMSEAADMLGDGLIDAFTILAIAPAGPIQEVASTREVKMLPIDKDIVKQMVDKFGYTELSVPKSYYKFLDSDIPSFGSQTIIIANDKMSEADIYKITKALVENLDYLHTVHSNLKSLTAEKMASGTGVALHPGAEKYYKEIGAVK